jgi:hypothetical protein
MKFPKKYNIEAPYCRAPVLVNGVELYKYGESKKTLSANEKPIRVNSPHLIALM